jgi:hypothetical protein
LGIAIVPKGRPIRTDGLPKAPKENPGAKAGAEFTAAWGIGPEQRSIRM